jgi:hypothetical protein
MYETCYQCLYVVMFVVIIYILEQSLIWEWKFVIKKLTWELKYLDFILNALIVITKYALKQIQKIMIILLKMEVLEIMNQ